MTSLPPPGWYPDPENPRNLRWWDGLRWAAPTSPEVLQQLAAMQMQQTQQMHYAAAMQQAPAAQQAPGQQEWGYAEREQQEGPRLSAGARRALLVAGLAAAILVVAGGGVGIVASLGDPRSASADGGPSSGNGGSPVNANTSVCSAVHSLVTGEIDNTLSGWDPDLDEFDQTVAHDLRDEATQLSSLGANAAGAAATAIHNAAQSLTNLSVGITNRKDAAIRAARDSTNHTLAELRGACHF